MTAILVAAVAAKGIRDRSLAEAPFGGQTMQRDLGRYALTESCPESADGMRVLDPTRTPLEEVRLDGSQTQGDPEVRLEGPGDTAAWAFAFTLEPEGYVSIDLPLQVTREWILRSHLTLCLRGSGQPISLQVAIQNPGETGIYRASNQLVLSRETWTRLRIPLLRLLDAHGAAWPGAAGDARLELTLSPFSGWQAGEIDAELDLAWVAIEGDASAGFDDERRAAMLAAVPREAPEPSPRESAPQQFSAGVELRHGDASELPPRMKTWADCSDEAATERFGSNPTVISEPQGPCAFTVSLEGDQWLIWRWHLADPPTAFDDRGQLLIRGTWSPGLRARVSLRRGETVVSDPSIWMHSTDSETTGVLAISGALLAGGDNAAVGPWSLDMDLHGTSTSPTLHRIAIEWIAWQAP